MAIADITLSPKTGGRLGVSAIGCARCGGRCLVVAVNAAVPVGGVYARPSNDGYHVLRSCILTRTRALTLPIQGRSRVPLFRSHESVRGAISDDRPYRDRTVCRREEFVIV